MESFLLFPKYLLLQFRVSRPRNRFQRGQVFHGLQNLTQANLHLQREQEPAHARRGTKSSNDLEAIYGLVPSSGRVEYRHSVVVDSPTPILEGFAQGSGLYVSLPVLNVSLLRLYRDLLFGYLRLALTDKECRYDGD